MFFIHLSLDGDLGYFHVLAIVNNSAMNMGLYISFFHLFLLVEGYKIYIVFI